MGTIVDGTYRIRSDSSTTPLYFEWQADNSVIAAALNPESTAQMWKITLAQQPSIYSITNNAGFVQLSVATCTVDGETVTCVVCGGQQDWNFQTEGEQFAIGPADTTGTCIELADNNSFYIEDFSGAANQLFSLEAVVPDVATGNYSVRNRATQGVLSVLTDFDRVTAPVRVWPDEGTNSDYNTWAVEPTRGGYTVKNSKAPVATPRWLSQYNGPVVMLQENICRLTRVQDTNYYYIGVSRDQDAFVLMDTNPTGTEDGWVSTAELLDGETTQQWEFIATDST